MIDEDRNGEGLFDGFFQRPLPVSIDLDEWEDPAGFAQLDAAEAERQAQFRAIDDIIESNGRTDPSTVQVDLTQDDDPDTAAGPAASTESSDDEEGIVAERKRQQRVRQPS